MKTAPKRVVLIVDDESTAAGIERNLSRVGFTIRKSTGGEEALRILRSVPVDLILCDVMMPGMNGFQFRENVIMDPTLRQIPFVFLSSLSGTDEQVRGLRTGADEYIVKPCDPLLLVARVLAVLERRRAYAELVRLDPLTQILNRHTLENEISREIERLKRHKGTGVLVFLDLDRFKRVNDEHGHAVGDLVLVKTADLLRRSTREIDFVGRYGGEEFVLYLPATRAADGAEAAQRLLGEIQKMPLQIPGLTVTFSAGVAEALAHGEDFPTLCERADQAMYEAKRLGRARVVVWSPSMM